MNDLQAYHRLVPFELEAGTVYSKRGVRGFPELPPGAAAFAAAAATERIQAQLRSAPAGTCVDATGTAGIAGLVLAGERELRVLEPSKAALRAAQRSAGDERVAAALPWEAAEQGAALLLLSPPADRGSRRVQLEIAAAARALAPDGLLLLQLHKDQGAKRYAKEAAQHFRSFELVHREKGWRFYVGSGPRQGAGQGVEELLWTEFGALDLHLVAHPGVYAAGKLDPGTKVLLDMLPVDRFAGQELLDLGCGYGLIGLACAAAGARVTAVDDDLAAVRSAQRNFAAQDLEGQVLHSDVDSELGQQEFGVVVTNPPFHVGKGVRLDVPAAFFLAARRLLRPGGELWLVANRQLPYEPLLKEWKDVQLLAEDAGFKVLRAVKP